MAEETKAATRLSKAAKEFNIGVTTAVEFLAKKGHEVDSNPNTKLTAEQYTLLAKEYQGDKAVRQEAENIDLGLGKKKAPVTVDDIKPVETKSESESESELADGEDEELRIKKVSLVENVRKSSPKKKKDHVKESTGDVEEAMEAMEAMVATDVAEAADVVEAEETVEVKEVRVSKETKDIQEEVIAAEQETVAAVAEQATTEAKKEEKKEVEANKAPATLHLEPEVKKVEPKVETKEETKVLEEVKQESKPEAELKSQVQPETITIEQEVEPTVKAELEPQKTIEPQKELVEEVGKVGEEQVESVATEVAESAEKSTKGGLKILGTVDLSTISSHGKKGRNKDNRDNRDAKRDNAHKSRDNRDVAKQEPKQEPKQDNRPKFEPKVAEPQKVNAPVEKAVETAPAPAPTPSVDKKPDNFLPTITVKLAGPRIVGEKIDLGQFDRKPKPVASSKDISNAGGKKKRPRTGDRKNDNSPTSITSHPNAPKNKKRKPLNNNRKEPAQINEQEVEKTLRDTLARLSPIGKSKASKHRREKRQSVSMQIEEQNERMMQEQKVLKVTEFVTVNELATMMSLPVTDIISTCMSLGLFVSINQRLTAEPISLLAEEYGYTVEFVDAEVLDELEHQDENEENLGEDEARTPIVTVMGHVDHGKTSLLDYIRKANVIAGEAGGITQHIGAYEVRLESGKRITFLDTPGHEAFTAMRARGAKITDIAIIVISADDKVMPQTIEAINHAQAAGVPIVFAINKIDKAGADPDRIKTQLADMNLLVEEWGGKYQSQDIAAKQGLNVDQLLEKVLLEAEMLELKANPRRRGKGTVIESALDKGRGYVAKVLVQEGSVSIGDPIIAGSTHGRVKAMYNERNQPVKTAGPSAPVLMLGFNGAPQAGDAFNVTKDEKEAKDIANRRVQLQREQGLRTQKHITLDEIGRRIAIGDFKELNIIVKGDVDGSIEALSDSLLRLSTGEVQVNVIHKSVGQITESDVMLASASNAVIIGFQVRPSLSARRLAESEQIDIRLYSIIYDAINEITDAIEGMLSPEIQEKIVANLEIREVFKINKLGTIAGCIVLDGRLSRSAKIRIIRDGIVVYTGKLGSLRRFKDDVKEVMVGQDCGLNIENFNDIKVGDIIEGYEQTEVKRTL